MLNGLLDSDYATPDQANGACWRASSRFVKGLKEIGIDAHLISCDNFLGDASGFHSWYTDCGFVKNGVVTSGAFGHWVVRVGGAYIDLTARQFFPAADYPQLYRKKDMDALWRTWGDI